MVFQQKLTKNNHKIKQSSFTTMKYFYKLDKVLRNSVRLYYNPVKMFIQTQKPLKINNIREQLRIRRNFN